MNGKELIEYILFSYQLFGFENLSSLSFHLHVSNSTANDYQSETILKMATGILIYTAIYLGQRIVTFAVTERYVKNSIQQFIDVCSLANVSVFMLLYDSYGFYIHGRSPHGFSDTDMCSMIMQLRREEDNVCGRRGLLLNSEQQTYSILVPKNLR